MGAPKGNRFWEARSRHGRKPLWDNPQELYDACVEYFEWVEANPLWDNQVIAFQGQGYDHALPKMRAMTIEGLCVFLGIGTNTWGDYKNKEGFSSIVNLVNNTMYEQKLTGAAAGLLNSNIIARELKLKDSVDANVGGQAGNPLLTDNTFKIEFVNAETSNKS